MFKNYLTYQFALSFDRSCRTAEVSDALRSELAASSEKMLGHFKKSLEVEDTREQAKLLFVAILCLRDCRDTLERAGIRIVALEAQYNVLHRRLEQLCASLIPAEKNGQLRMFG